MGRQRSCNFTGPHVNSWVWWGFMQEQSACCKWRPIEGVGNEASVQYSTHSCSFSSEQDCPRQSVDCVLKVHPSDDVHLQCQVYE